MKTHLFIIVIGMLLGFSMPMHGQSLLERMAKKAAEKAEKKAEKETEKKIEEELNKQFEEDSETEETDQPEHADQQDITKMMKKMGIASTPVKIEDAYTFSSSIKMNIKTFDGNGQLKSDGDIVSYINKGQSSFAYEFISGEIETKNPQKGMFIIDYDNKATIILSDENGSKQGIVYGMDDLMNPESWQSTEELEGEETTPLESPLLDPRLKKTGRTKTISGYKCNEYVYTESESEDNTITTFWLTKDIDWQTKDLMSNIFGASMYSRGMPWGFLMESESIDQDTGEKSLYKVTDINPSTKNIQLKRLYHNQPGQHAATKNR